MKTITRLISAIAKEMFISEDDIKTSKKHYASAARSVLFLLALHNKCANEDELNALTGIRQSACRVGAKNAHQLYSIDKSWRRHIDNISISIFKHPYKTDAPIINTKRKKEKPQRDINKNPFGIVYTDSDKLLMKRAIERAFAFMENYGKGEQPLCEGFPITRQQSH